MAPCRAPSLGGRSRFALSDVADDTLVNQRLSLATNPEGTRRRRRHRRRRGVVVVDIAL